MHFLPGPYQFTGCCQPKRLTDMRAPIPATYPCSGPCDARCLDDLPGSGQGTIERLALLGGATPERNASFRCAVLGGAGDRCGWQLNPVEVIPGYTGPMKTAISLPDETFERVSRRASDLGMSRSEFFTRAAQRYLDELDAQSLTGQIDSALEHLGGTGEAEAAAVAVGHRVLDAVDDEW